MTRPNLLYNSLKVLCSDNCLVGAKLDMGMFPVVEPQTLEEIEEGIKATDGSRVVHASGAQRERERGEGMSHTWSAATNATAFLCTGFRSVIVGRDPRNDDAVSCGLNLCAACARLPQ